MRLDNLLQREGLGHQRLELARSQAIDDKLLGDLQTLRVAGNLKQGITTYGQLLTNRTKERQWRWLGAERTILKNDAALGCGISQLADGWPTYGVEYYARAFAIGDAIRFCHQILLFCSNHVFG